MLLSGLCLAVVALCRHEAELGVSQDVVICAADSVLGGPDEQVSVVGSCLPPDGQVGAHLAQQQALVEQLVAKDLFPHLAKQLHPVKRSRRSLLCDGLDVQGRLHRSVWNKRRRSRCECVRGNEGCFPGTTHRPV